MSGWMLEFLAVGVFGGSVVENSAGVRSELNGRWSDASTEAQHGGVTSESKQKLTRGGEKGDVKQEGEIGGGVV